MKLVDGGVTHPLGIEIAKKYNPKLVIAVDLSIEIEQDDVDTVLQQVDEEIPYSSEAPMLLQQPGRQQNLQGGGGNSSNGTGVNVQTTSQPVLVIPMNVGQAAPTEIIPSPIAGAPSTIAVDTSEKALNSLGLPPQNQRPANRGISPHARRPSSNASGGGGSKSAAPVVTVQRQGASSSASSTNSNVRINVTKQN
jgi:predicted acylesterase/phospholipase RssA